MHTINITQQYMPGTERGFDGKMSYYWNPYPAPVDYSTVDVQFLRWFHDRTMELGFRYIWPDPEGNSTASNGLELWTRSDYSQAQASAPLYGEFANQIRLGTEVWQDKRNLAEDYITWGLYGFPRWGRRVAEGGQSAQDYEDQVRLEAWQVTRHMPVLAPNCYVQQPQYYRSSCEWLAQAIEWDASINGPKPVYCYIKKNDKNGDMTAREFTESLEILREVVNPTAVLYWESVNTWNGEPMDKLQMLEILT